MDRTRLFLVRHGETQWNRDARVQGHMDITLSQVGREQARAIAARLAGEKTAAVYSSDLARARETAELIASRHSIPVTVVPALREGCFGAWEGLNLSEIRDRFADNYTAYRAEPVNTQPEGGESCLEVAARAQSAVQEIAERHAGETVIVVSHGGTLKTILCGLLGLDLSLRSRFALDNCGLSCVEFGERGPVVVSLNDTAHLKDAPVADAEA